MDRNVEIALLDLKKNIKIPFFHRDILMCKVNGINEDFTSSFRGVEDQLQVFLSIVIIIR